MVFSGEGGAATVLVQSRGAREYVEIGDNDGMRFWSYQNHGANENVLLGKDLQLFRLSWEKPLLPPFAPPPKKGKKKRGEKNKANNSVENSLGIGNPHMEVLDRYWGMMKGEMGIPFLKVKGNPHCRTLSYYFAHSKD